MNLYRYMSMDEFTSMLAGVPIVGRNTCSTCRTTSSGVCFLGEETTFFPAESHKPVTFSPEDCFRFLSGIVSDEVLVKFQVKEVSFLNEGKGIYADPVSFWDWDAEICITEYSVPSYDRDTFVPVGYAIPDRESRNWFWWNL